MDALNLGDRDKECPDRNALVASTQSALVRKVL